MRRKIIGIIHCFGMVFQSFYAVILPKTDFDWIYLFSFLCIWLSQLAFYDECIISYYIKHLDNPKYRLGDEPENAKDIIELFSTKNQYMIFYHVNTVFRAYSIVTVNARNDYILPNIVTITAVFMYVAYNYDILYVTNYRCATPPTIMRVDPTRL